MTLEEKVNDKGKKLTLKERIEIGLVGLVWGGLGSGLYYAPFLFGRELIKNYSDYSFGQKSLLVAGTAGSLFVGTILFAVPSLGMFISALSGYDIDMIEDKSYNQNKK